MGFKCGTQATLWKDERGTGNHAVTMCADPSSGEFFMVNYGTIFSIDANTFEEAIDASNALLGYSNTQGSITSCFGDTDKARDNCVHEYIPADARWGIASIQGGMEEMWNEAPLKIKADLSNVGIDGSISSFAHFYGGGDRGGQFHTSLGVLGTYRSYNGHHFQSAGLVFGHKVEHDSSRTEFDLFAGQFHSVHPNLAPGLYLNDDTVSTTGLIGIVGFRHEQDLSDRHTIYADMEVVGHGTIGFDAGGFTDQINFGSEYQLTDRIGFGFNERGFVNGNMENNSVIARLGQSSLSLSHHAGDETKPVEANTEIKFHALHSGQGEAVAVELEGDVTVRAGRHLAFTTEYDVAYTSASEYDPFYQNPTLFYSLDSDLTLNVSDRFRISGYADLSSGQTPSHLGEGIVIDPEITPERRVLGVESGVKLDLAF